MQVDTRRDRFLDSFVVGFRDKLINDLNDPPIGTQNVGCELRVSQVRLRELMTYSQSHGEQPDRGGRIILRTSESEVVVDRGFGYAVEGTITLKSQVKTSD